MLKDGLERCPGCMETFSGADACPNCGRPKNCVSDGEYLRPGTSLCKGRYFVGDISGKNGEGATYKGFDNRTGQTCWIREYFPTALAFRAGATGMVLPAEGNEAQYKALISDFVDVCNEVKRLAVTENVIPITNGFVDNNSFYAVYEHMKIISFDEYLAQNGGKLPFQQALELLVPLCSMVGTIHDRGHIHRGVSPSTVYVDDLGTLYLWGFSLSAARTAGSELKAELFNGYSAPEQYSPSGWQGAWTDVYALAAMFYRAISGFVPPKSVLVGGDRRVAALHDLMPEVPKNISDAVAAAMETTAEKRTQSVYGFISALMDSGNTHTAVYDVGGKKREDIRGHDEEKEKDGGFKYAFLALVFTAVMLLCGLVYVTKSMFPQMLEPSYPIQPDSDMSESEAESEPEPEPEPEPDVTVPRFVGQMLSVIQADPNYSERFEFSVEQEFNDDFPEGVVFKQSPEEDVPMPNPGTVILYVSKGPEMAEMPNLVGLEWMEALRVLGEQNLPCEKLDRYTPGAKPGVVVGASPAAGTRFNPKKETVIVYVMPEVEPESKESSSKPESSSKSGSSKSSSTKSSSSKSSGSSRSSSSSRSTGR